MTILIAGGGIGGLIHRLPYSRQHGFLISVATSAQLMPMSFRSRSLIAPS